MSAVAAAPASSKVTGAKCGAGEEVTTETEPSPGDYAAVLETAESVEVAAAAAAAAEGESSKSTAFPAVAAAAAVAAAEVAAAAAAAAVAAAGQAVPYVPVDEGTLVAARASHIAPRAGVPPEAAAR